MPGQICAVASCKSNRLILKREGVNLAFHSFSNKNDLVSATIRKEWINRCKREDKFNPKTSSICSLHFTPNDYERDLQNELLGLPLRRVLKKTAVPTLNLNVAGKKSLIPPTDDTPRAKRAEKKKNKDLVQLLLAETSPSNPEPSQLLDIPSTSTAVPSSCTDKLSEQPSTSSSTDIYKQKYEDLLLKYNQLHLIQSKSNKKIKGLNTMLKYYKMKCYNQSINKNTKSVMTEKLLNMVLTTNQISLLSKKKKVVRWTHEEISVAFTLRYYSKKCYLYLRNTLNYPLPALSSLRRWASRLDVSQGILKDVLLMMKLASENLTPFEKTVVLQFDEVKVKSVEEYDVAKDQVLGPHSQLQVVQARALFSKWKQPVYIAFDQKVTKDILCNIITELHNISYNVVACVSDCGGGNIGLWKELNVNMETPFFKHPQSDSNVYMFADAPHLLKLIRNWLLNTGFILKEGITVTKGPLQALVNHTSSEINPCWKINQSHIDCENTKRQNVKMAAQLLSHSVSTALIRYTPGPDKKMAKDLGDFIGDINKWFDIFNSYTKNYSVPTKNAYGLNLEMQEEHLQKMINIISSMRVTGKKSLQIFQKGMIMSMRSLQMLFRDMKNTYNAQYICTHKLNQDGLENLFAQIRCRGPNEHPSPLEAIYRIRMIILGKNSGILEAKVNTRELVNEEYITPKILEKAKLHLNTSLLEETTKSNSSSSFSSIGSTSEFGNISGSSLNKEKSLPEAADDAIEYIAGYLAKKHKEDHPELGDFTYKIKSDHSYNIPSWVQQLSFGGLIKPQLEWLEKVKKWNFYFEKYANNIIKVGTGVVKKLSTKIKKKESVIPLNIIKDFCKLRLIIRIRYNNLQTEFRRDLKRKLSTTDDSRRSKTRKLKKIVY